MGDEQRPDIPNPCASGCIRYIAATWFGTLTDLHPGLGSDEVRAQVVRMTESMVGAVSCDPFDPEPILKVGLEMDALAMLHPQDVLVVQESIARAFSEAMPAELWPVYQPRIASLLFGLAASYYVARSERATRFNVAVTSRMGHDLKTPINAITGFSRVMLKGIDGPITDFQREDLTSIYEAGQRLLTLINDLYAVKKQDAGHSPVPIRPFLVAELLGEIVRTGQPLAAERDHVFGVQALGDLGTMDLDPSRVRWILLALLCYAIRGSSGGEIILSAQRDYSDGVWIEFRLVAREGSTMPDVSQGGGEGVDLAGQADEVQVNDDAFELVSCRQACEELRGTLAWTVSDAHQLTVTARLPATNPGLS